MSKSTSERDEFRQRLLGGAPASQTPPLPKRAKPQTRRRDRSALPPLLWAVVGGLGFSYAVVSGSPALRSGWRPLALLIGLAVSGASALFIAGAWPRLAPGARRAVAIVSTAMVVLLAAGVSNQVVIDGKVYWRGSTEARAWKTAVALRTDLFVLAENEALLQLPYEQGRGLAAAYVQAIAQADSVALRWNPVSSEAPLAGMKDAYAAANAAAATQARALQLYLDNLEVPDTAREAEVARLAALAEGQYSQAAAALGATLKAEGVVLPDDRTGSPK